MRFVVWLLLAMLLPFGIGALGYLLPASGLKIYLAIGLQIIFNLLFGWLLGLISIQKRSQIGPSIFIVTLALAIPFILLFFAIVSTVFCGIDACGT